MKSLKMLLRFAIVGGLILLLLVPLMMDRQGVRDFLGFDWAGGWNYNKGRYCVSIPGAYTGALNYLTGHDLGALLGVTAEDRRFYPLTVLPKPI